MPQYSVEMPEGVKWIGSAANPAAARAAVREVLGRLGPIDGSGMNPGWGDMSAVVHALRALVGAAPEGEAPVPETEEGCRSRLPEVFMALTHDRDAALPVHRWSVTIKGSWPGVSRTFYGATELVALQRACDALEEARDDARGVGERADPHSDYNTPSYGLGPRR